MSSARLVSWYALLVMVFLVPVAMSNLTFLRLQTPFTFDVFDIVKMSLERVLGLVALGAWAWDMLRNGGRIRRTPLDWLILAFLAWVALTTVTSIHWPTALFGKPRRYEGLLSFVNYAVIYFLVLQFADHASRVRRLAQSLFWASVIVAGYGLLQFAGLEFVIWGALPFETNRAFSTYGNPDLLGGFLIFSVTVALGLALLEQRLVWRLVYWVGFGLNGLALIVAFTRGAWIGGAVSLALLGAIAWRQRTPMRRIDWAPAGVSVAVGIGVIWRSLSNPNEVMNFGKRLGSIFQLGGGSGQTRTEIWQAAVAAYLRAQTAPSLTERTAESLRAVKLNPLNPQYRGSVGLAYLDEVRAYLRAGAQAQKNGRDTTQYAEAVKKHFASAESALAKFFLTASAYWVVSRPFFCAWAPARR